MSSDIDRFAQPRGIAELGIAVLAGPIVWAGSFLANYILVPFSCGSAAHLALHASAAVALTLTIGASFLSWRHWRSLGVEWPRGSGSILVQRTRFLAATGLVLNAVFATLISAQWLVIGVVSPCLR